MPLCAAAQFFRELLCGGWRTRRENPSDSRTGDTAHCADDRSWQEEHERQSKDFGQPTAAPNRRHSAWIVCDSEKSHCPDDADDGAKAGGREARQRAGRKRT